MMSSNDRDIWHNNNNAKCSFSGWRASARASVRSFDIKLDWVDRALELTSGPMYIYILNIYNYIYII